MNNHPGEDIYTNLHALARLRFTARGFSYLPRQPVRSLLSGRKRSRLRGRGLDFDELRHYRPGDDIRNMDWRVTARTGRAHTKVFQEERERPVLIVLDASPSLYFGTRTRLKSVAAGYLAASIAWTAVKRGDRIGAFLFAPGEHREIRPAGGRRGAMRIINGLVDWLQPDGKEPGGAPLSESLQRVRHVLRPGSLVLVISDFFNLDDDCNRHLSRLRQHNDVIGCQVLDPAEETLPAGRYPITDGLQSSLLDTSGDRGRQRFDAMSLDHIERPRRLFQRHQCGWVTMRTHDDPVEVLGRDLRILMGQAA